jgi:uncharacterized membrane-anchored protein
LLRNHEAALPEQLFFCAKSYFSVSFRHPFLSTFHHILQPVGPREQNAFLALLTNLAMKKKILLLAIMPLMHLCHAQSVDSLQIFIDSVEANFQYQLGEIDLDNGIGRLRVPEGFRFLDAKQSTYVLEDLWGNPEDPAVLGMIVPQQTGLLADNAWAFIITYDEMGYVKDDDADDIDYDDLLADMQEETKAENEVRKEAGYESIEIVGWASTPYYDNDKKVLHWAKEIKFGENEKSTLNYNVRILGRKGVMVLNAVASMNELPEVKKSIDPVLQSFSYAEGTAYSDFNPEMDEVAAWTIGGLVAGKMLAKVGLFAFLLKYIKLIGIGLVALGGAIWKWWKRKTELPVVRNLEGESNG